MKNMKLKKLVTSFLIITLIGTTPLTYAAETSSIETVQIENSIWKLDLMVGETLPSTKIKQWLEEKNNIVLDSKDEIKIIWTKGENLFDEGKAQHEGTAFIKLKIKDYDEQEKCRIINQCIEVEIVKKPVSIIHLPYINGYEDGTFRPERGITREELATMVGRLMLGGQKPIHRENFDDVSDSRYSASYIGYVTELGMMSGYEDGTFRPSDFVSKQEFMGVVRRINKYYGKQIDIKTMSSQHISRVESVILLNELFGRACSDVAIPNMYSDIDENTWAYADILYASIYHIHE